MKVLSVMLAIAPVAVLSHYTFPNLIVNGRMFADWQYVRMTANHYNQASVDNVNSPSIRCFEDKKQPHTTGVMSVAAGARVGFKASNTMGHPGPVLFYMAKAPADKKLEQWDGSGNVWFKIFEEGARTDSSGVHFKTGMTTINATIPRSLPAGDYLLRGEHIAVHKMKQPQFYIACAQLRVTGGGSGHPAPLVSFPGAYKKQDPGVDFNMYASPVVAYQIPGPRVWKG